MHHDDISVSVSHAMLELAEVTPDLLIGLGLGAQSRTQLPRQEHNNGYIVGGDNCFIPQNSRKYNDTPLL